MEASCELLRTASERIQQARTTMVALAVRDAAGHPITNAHVHIELARHAFKFGSNAFLVGCVEDDALQAAYEERFAKLLNYATLPFYWGSYEPVQGETRSVRLREMAVWCREHDILAKGHPLTWHETVSPWAAALDDSEVLRRLEARVRALPAEFRGVVDIWDVVNEATVSSGFDNAVGRWIRDRGAAAAVGLALGWARAANPSATLLYNDFNVGPDFERLIAELLDLGAPLDAIGIQSHMHCGTWTLERAWEVCETYSRFGLPLHFTELTVLSGRLKSPDDKDWHRVHTDWESTPEGEQAQADYVEQLYTLLFSHPAVEAITWWDFADYRAWQGAPAGFLREDMSPKPVYDRLMDLIHRAWRTDFVTTTDAMGVASGRCFFGDHQIQVELASGATLQGHFLVERGGAKRVEVTVA